MHKIKPGLLFAVCAWSLLILRFGYRYGTGDQVELLPYTLYLHDHSLYPHDFFIQGLNASTPNERTVMAHLLLPFVNHLEITCFLLQLLTTLILVMGLERLAGKFMRNKYFVWLSVLIALIPLNDFALGNVEIYSECLQASGVATAMAVWAINLFLERRFFRASALLAATTFIQVLEGLDVMIVLSVIMFFMWTTNEIKRKTFLYFIALYAFSAGFFLAAILHGKSATDIEGYHPATNAELFSILFQFRHPHHFIFPSFPKFKMIVFFILTLIGLMYYSKHSSKVFEIMLFGLFGVIIYAFATDDFHSIFIANFQFYKITQWMKFLGVVAVVGLFEGYLVNRLTEWPPIEKPALIVLTVLCWVVVLKFNDYLPYKVPYQLFGMKDKDDMISICGQIRDSVPKDAVFIQPFDNTELKFYARRSSFVEFKANVRHSCFVKEWYTRIQRIYGISSADEVKGFALKDKADENYYTHSPWQFGNWIGFGITHMLVKKDYHPISGTLILSNKSYAVYKL